MQREKSGSSSDQVALDLTGVQLLEHRLAKGTIFADAQPHLHVVPSTTNPAPLGFFSFGFCCILLMGVFAEWIPPSSAHIVYAYSFTFAGLGQLLTGILEYNRKNVFACNAFCTYGFFFLGFALQRTLEGAQVPGWAPAAKGTQMAFILWGCITFLFMIQALAINFALFFLFFNVAILFMCVAAEQTHPSIAKGVGWYGVFSGLISIYLAMSIFFIENYGKEVLPLGHFHWGAWWVQRRRLGPVGTKRTLDDTDATNV